MRGGSNLSVKFSRYNIKIYYDSNDFLPIGWVKTERKTMVSFKYKSTAIYGVISKAEKFHSAWHLRIMDELCSTTRLKPSGNKSIETDNKSKAMDKLIHELIGDRLLELSRYITMDVSGRVVFIDKTAFVADGYQVILH